MKIFRKILSMAVISAIVACMLVFTSKADGSSTISCKTSAAVGDAVAVTVNLKAGGEDGEIWGAVGNFGFDANMLSFVDCSGAVCNASEGNIKFTATGSGGSSVSATFNFTVISAGKCVVSANDMTYSGGANNSSYAISGSSVAINLSDAAAQEDAANPNDASLSSLRISGADISPAFSSKVTSYTATVGYSVSSVTISATAVNSKAKITGTGNVELEVGENKKEITVNANGNKKTYTVTIKRLSEAEELAGNPLIVTIGEKTYNVLQDISTLVIPNDYTAIMIDYKSAQVAALSDNHSKYILYYLSEQETGETALFKLSESGEFERLNCFLFGNEIYIVEPEEEKLFAPNGYYKDIYTIDTGDIDVYRSEDPELLDFCWIHIYHNGKAGYYRYDTAEKTLQRDMKFEPLFEDTSKVEAKGFSFSSLTTTAKVILGLLALGIIIVVVLLILIIKKIKSRDPEMIVDFSDEPYGDNSSIFNDIDLDGIEPKEK